MSSDSSLLPPVIRRWFWTECPVCHRRWLSSRWDSFRYPLHYAAEHLDIPPWRQL